VTEDQTPEALWKDTKEVLLEAAKDIVGYMQQQTRKTWISDKIFDTINDKNNAKTKDPQTYEELKSEVQKILRKDKQISVEPIADWSDPRHCQILHFQSTHNTVDMIVSRCMSYTLKSCRWYVGLLRLIEQSKTLSYACRTQNAF